MPPIFPEGHDDRSKALARPLLVSRRGLLRRVLPVCSEITGSLISSRRSAIAVVSARARLPLQSALLIDHAPTQDLIDRRKGRWHIKAAPILTKH